MYPFLSHLYKEKLLLYTDTDSIFFTKQGLKYMQKRINSTKIGFFKIESVLTKGAFLGLKLYVMQRSDKSVEIKCKGLTKEQLVKALGLNKEKDIVASFTDTVKKNEGILTIDVKDVEVLKRNLTTLNISTLFEEVRSFDNSMFAQYRKKGIKKKSGYPLPH
jgi:DNA polymerase elongation subunit (family B)